jgi:broad specificity phosphatase PhoE
MLELLIIRHGETAWNAGEVFRGRVQIPLSEKGIKQAELLGQYLSEKKINAIYCSPLERAVKTALPIAKKQNLEVKALDGLNDLDFGEWEGLSVPEVKIRYKEAYEYWLKRPDVAPIPGGETIETARKRVMKALDEIMTAHKEGTLVIVTHRVIAKILECALLGLDNSHFWYIDQDTCGVTTFLHNGYFFVLKHHNDVSFLKSLG